MTYNMDSIEKFLKEKRLSLQQERLKLDNEKTETFNELILNEVETNSNSSVYNNSNNLKTRSNALIKNKNEKIPIVNNVFTPPPSAAPNKVKINHNRFWLDDNDDAYDNDVDADDINKSKINNQQIDNRLRIQESNVQPSVRTNQPKHLENNPANYSLKAPVKSSQLPATTSNFNNNSTTVMEHNNDARPTDNMDQWVTDAFFSYFPSYSNQIKKKENFYSPSNYQIGSSNENERHHIRKRQEFKKQTKIEYQRDLVKQIEDKKNEIERLRLKEKEEDEQLTKKLEDQLKTIQLEEDLEKEKYKIEQMRLKNEQNHILRMNLLSKLENDHQIYNPFNNNNNNGQRKSQSENGKENLLVPERKKDDTEIYKYFSNSARNKPGYKSAMDLYSNSYDDNNNNNNNNNDDNDIIVISDDYNCNNTNEYCHNCRKTFNELLFCNHCNHHCKNYCSKCGTDLQHSKFGNPTIVQSKSGPSQQQHPIVPTPPPQLHENDICQNCRRAQDKNNNLICRNCNCNMVKVDHHSNDFKKRTKEINDVEQKTYNQLLFGGDGTSKPIEEIKNLQFSSHQPLKLKYNEINKNVNSNTSIVSGSCTDSDNDVVIVKQMHSPPPSLNNKSSTPPAPPYSINIDKESMFHPINRIPPPLEQKLNINNDIFTHKTSMATNNYPLEDSEHHHQHHRLHHEDEQLNKKTQEQIEKYAKNYGDLKNKRKRNPTTTSNIFNNLVDDTFPLPLMKETYSNKLNTSTNKDSLTSSSSLKSSRRRSGGDGIGIIIDKSPALKMLERKWEIPAVQKNSIMPQQKTSTRVLTQLGAIRKQLQLEQLSIDDDDYYNNNGNDKIFE